MPTISPSDVMFATVIQRGQTIYRGRFTGMSSLSQIISHIVHLIGNVAGMVNLALRNSSQGWSQSTYCRFRLAEGTQLSLF